MAFEFDPTTAQPADAIPQDPSKTFDPVTAREQDGPLARWFKKAGQSMKMTAQLVSGDTAGTAQTVQEATDYARANPGMPEGQKLMDAWNKGDGVTDAIGNVAGQIKSDYDSAKGFIPGARAVGRDLRAMGEGIVEQVPNMIAPTAGMLFGGAAGGVAGSEVPVVGNAVGAALGGWAGASAGNALVEGGDQIQTAIQKAGIDPNDTHAVEAFLDANKGQLLKQIAVKGGIIGAVDTATAGLEHWLLTGPGRAATGRALSALGVDAADDVAVKAAKNSPEFRSLIAKDAAYQASQQGAGHIARNATAAALEPAGEFAGEYVGQGAATGDWDAKNAALEALSSVGQSGAMFAGQKAIEYATKPKAGESGAAGVQLDDGTLIDEGAIGPDQSPPGISGLLPAPVYEAGADGTIRTTADINAEMQARRQAEVDRLGRIQRGEVVDVTPIPAAPKLSEQMGLDPAAGPLSGAAVMAVDSGATEHFAQQAAIQMAAEEAQKGKGKPVEQQQSGLLSDATETVSPAATAAADPAVELQRRLDYINQQGKRSGWNREMVAERESVKTQLAQLQPQSSTPTSVQEGIQQAQAKRVAEPVAQQAATATQQPTAAEVKAITAKQIPQMTDAELQIAANHYGPEHKRAAKLQKEMQRRGVQPVQTAQESLNGQQPAQQTPAAVPVAQTPVQNTAQGAESVQATAAPAVDHGARWESMTPEQKTAVLTQPGGWSTNKGGLNVIGKELTKKGWDGIPDL